MDWTQKASYAALAVQTREYLIIVMWAGQLAGELLNYIIKHIFKQDRPNQSLGTGYAFPSSHSQYMGYFSVFLICHLYYRHRFPSTGYPVVDRLWRACVYAVLVLWAVLVAYSRYHLNYHTPFQIICGLLIGIFLGIFTYTFSFLLPAKYPSSPLGQVHRWLVRNPVSRWIGIRDGWSVWGDAGSEEEWKRWEEKWIAKGLDATGKGKKETSKES
ncbi:hypothetical protein AX16_008117 [Volvariella volvacea WC 439]|nr:hypothetical protein AX16_008117 [Volvariella volvacea WC 439]